jgi:ABC-type antimicrobial peptide transport system permease subunit
VLRRVAALGAAAVAIGLPLAWLLSGTLSAMLDNVSATDGHVYAAVAVFLFAVLLAAAYLPVRRAALADPRETLKATS